MTLRNRVGLWWYNATVPYKNWKIRRMWRADPKRPKQCPQIARMSAATLERLSQKAAELKLRSY